MSIRRFAVASLIAWSGVTIAVASTTTTSAVPAPPMSSDDAGRHHWQQPPSAERFAMENIMAEKLSQQTGRSAADIQALMGKGPPQELAKSLGLDETAMRSTFAAARQTLIQRMTEASLITAAQAEELKNEPAHHGHHGPMGGPPPRPDASGDSDH